MNPILAGLQLIAIYDPDFDTCAEHDEFFVSFDASVKMNQEDIERLEKMGWRKFDSDYSWSIFT